MRLFVALMLVTTLLVVTGCSDSCVTEVVVITANGVRAEAPTPVAAIAGRRDTTKFNTNELVVYTTNCMEHGKVVYTETDTLAHFSADASVYLCTPDGCKVQSSVETAKAAAIKQRVATVYARVDSTHSVDTTRRGDTLFSRVYSTRWVAVYRVTRHTAR